MIEVTLKEYYECSFCRNEVTNYRLWEKEKKRSLTNGETVCLISLTGNQIAFVWKPTTVHVKSREIDAFRSLRIRLAHNSAWWEPGVLQHYANSIGLHLVGLKRYEEYWKEYLGG